MANHPAPRILLATVLAAAAALLLTCGRDPEAHDRRLPRSASGARAVKVAEVRLLDGERTITLPGVTRATRRAALAFAASARLETRPVEVGDRVEHGQTLAAIDAREFRLAEQAAASRVAELEAKLTQARRDLDRVEELAAKRAATEEEQEQTRSAVEALEAARETALTLLADARRRLDEATLRAPFAATVTAVHLEPGEWANAGRPVVELAGSGPVEVAVEAPESVRGSIVKQTPVEVRLPFLDDRVTTGTVTQVAEAASGPGALFQVEIALAPTPGLVPGTTVEVDLPVKAARQLAIPVKAVIDPGSSRPSVFRVEGDRAYRTPVVPLRVVGDLLTIEAPLAQGDLVAVTGHTALADGDTVEVKP